MNLAQSVSLRALILKTKKKKKTFVCKAMSLVVKEFS